MLHGRHFTYKSIHGDTAITFVSSGVEGAFATEEHPYAAHGPWLQVLILWHTRQLQAAAGLFYVSNNASSAKILLTEEFVEQMLGDIQELGTRDEVRVKSLALLLRFWVIAYMF